MSSTVPSARACSNAMPDAYLRRLRRLRRALGIPRDYSARRHLPVQREARHLVNVGLAADDGQPVRLAPGAAAAWKRMRAAAARSGIELLPLSGCPGYAGLNEDFAKTAAFRWLKRRAGEFGFWLSYPRGNPHGIAFEPWHWCWI